MIEAIERLGMLVGECDLPGERKRDKIFPAHPSGLQLSQDRWLLLIATRGLRQYDDDHSIVYQLRADSPDGALLREDFLQQSCNDYDPFEDGSTYVCLLRHPMGFGVPKGALIEGRPAPNANRFAALWTRSAAGTLDPVTGLYAIDSVLEMKSIHMMWCQFRLNDAEDDIEIMRAPEKLRQKGYAFGTAYCSHEDVGFMIGSLVPPVPFNDEHTEWASTEETGAGILAVKFRYDPSTEAYDWVETGPARIDDKQFRLTEPVLARMDDDWIIGVRPRIINPQQSPDWAGLQARDRGHTGWIKVEDPFTEMPYPTIVEDPRREAPMTIYRCADGVLRLFSGDLAFSPYKLRRDPLYCWDVNTDDFSVSNRQVIFDSVQAGVFPDDPTLQRSTCFAFVFPHAGGAMQIVAHRVMCFRYLPGMEANHPPITEAQLAGHGVYREGIRYREACPAAWSFAG